MNPLDEVMKAVADLRKLGCSGKQELLVAPDVYKHLDGIESQKDFYSAFCGINIFLVPEMPEGQMAIVPEGTNHKLASEMLRLRRQREEAQAKGQFTVESERQAEWLNWMERKGYIKVVKETNENGQLVQHVELTKKGKRVTDTEKYEQDKALFTETGKLPD